MLNIGMMELIVLLIVAFVIVGPKDLPKVARFLGRTVRYVRGLLRDIITTLNLEEEMEAVNEATGTLKEMKKQADDILNPGKLINPIEKEIYGVQRELESVIKNEIPPAKTTESTEEHMVQ